MENAFPNFFLIGPPKCATTAVSHYLSQHPDIFISKVKEPNYFIYSNNNPYGWPERGHTTTTKSGYLQLFRNTDNCKVIGEASPYYIYCNHCAEAMYAFAPNGKLLTILRNPVERAMSMYMYWHQNDPTCNNTSHESFRKDFLNERLVSDYNAEDKDNKNTIGWLKDMGFYGRQLQKYFSVFPENQICVLRYEDLTNDIVGTLRRIFQFLDVDPDVPIPGLDRKNVTIEPQNRRLYNWLNLNQTSPVRKVLKTILGNVPLAHHTRQTINRLNKRSRSIKNNLPFDIYNELIECYRSDIHELSSLTRIDFTDWLSEQVAAA